MSRFIWLLFAALPALAAAADNYEIERLERKCALERESLLRERNGTPACEQLDRIYGTARRTPRRRWLFGRRKKKYSGYYWNGAYGKNCTHDSKGDVIGCD
ncbi:hypothetical protein [Kingella potus]|uniref:hypothetical protein n=1 Tax=Kingella potus TaxID=265175 RepID=UPI001FD0AD95|nr:hypothetical protein [Kingella potus]UOP00818.1 hypothetical protein LVJ84_13910 [Kingella potus]